MTRQKKVIIIGSGLGGLSSGVVLAKNGYAVTVLEQGGQAGAACNVSPGVAQSSRQACTSSAVPHMGRRWTGSCGTWRLTGR